MALPFFSDSPISATAVRWGRG